MKDPVEHFGTRQERMKTLLVIAWKNRWSTRRRVSCRFVSKKTLVGLFLKNGPSCKDWCSPRDTRAQLSTVMRPFRCNRVKFSTNTFNGNPLKRYEILAKYSISATAADCPMVELFVLRALMSTQFRRAEYRDGNILTLYPDHYHGLVTLRHLRHVIKIEKFSLIF